MRPRRDILLFGLLAVVALAVGWWIVTSRPGDGIDSFAQHQKMRVAARPHVPLANTFRATICSTAPCAAVEAGGLTFLFAGGAGAGEGVRQLGLMHPAIDAILLPDNDLATVEGLPAIAAASARAGRREPLKVFGAAGLLPIIDGANIMASGAGAVRLFAAPEGEDQGIEGRVVFDSGVVTVRGFGGRELGSGRVYRIDFDGRSLVLAGCRASPADIVAAARTTQVRAGVLFAGSTRLGAGPDACLDLPDVTKAAQQGGMTTVLVAPIAPSLALPDAPAAWAELLKQDGPPGAGLGLKGARIDLSGESPRLIDPS